MSGWCKWVFLFSFVFLLAGAEEALATFDPEIDWSRVDSETKDVLNRCEKIVNQRAFWVASREFEECGSFYFYNSEFDYPSSAFRKVIRLLELSLKRDPRQKELYSDMAWLLYSQWANWKNNPEYIGDEAEDSAVKALLVAKLGAKFFANDPTYFRSVAMTLEPMVQYHLPEHYPAIEKLYLRAESLAQDKTLQARLRLDLGHFYRRQGRLAEAKMWYQRALLVDSHNKVATRILAELTATDLAVK